MNLASRILSAVPITGPLGLDNLVLSLDSKMATSTRVTSGFVLALKLTALGFAIYFLTAKKPDIEPYLSCRSCSEKHYQDGYQSPVESCEGGEWDTTWNSKEFRTWYESQYTQSKPTTRNQFVRACKKYGVYVENRKNQLNSQGHIALIAIGILWVAGMVVAFTAKRVA